LTGHVPPLYGESAVLNLLETFSRDGAFSLKNMIKRIPQALENRLKATA